MPERTLLQKWLSERAWRYLFTGALLMGAVFTALVYSVEWKFGVALVSFVTLLALDLYSLQLGILPIFFAIPMDRLGKIGPESIITWAKLLIGVLIIAWSVHVLVRRDRRPLAVLLRSPLFLLAILSLAFSFLSVINARDYDIFLSLTLRRVNNVALFVLIVGIVNSKAAVRRVLTVFLGAYFFIGLIVIYEIYSGQSILATVWGEQEVALEYTIHTGEFRVGGPGGDPDFLAISVILPSLLALSMLFAPVSRRVKLLLLPLLLLMMISLLATGSRGGLGAFLIGSTILWVFSRIRYKYLIAGAGALVLVATTLVLESAGAASTRRFTGEAGGTSIVYRLGWTEMAFRMIEDHPFAGIGTGNFPRRYNRYVRTVPIVPRRPHWTHNSFLQTWAENGVFAFVVYIGLFVTAAGLMLRVIRDTQDPELRRLAVVMLAAVAAYFFFAGTSNVLQNENYWIVFSLATVVASLASEEGHSRRGETAGGAGG